MTEPIKVEPAKTEPGAELKFSQQDLDRHIQERLARERQKYGDYEDLAKFKSEHQKQLDQQQQADLERQKEYEKLKEGWSSKESEYKNILTQKEQTIVDMKIGSTLTSEAMKQSAYPDAVDLIRGMTVVDKDGNIKIRGKDSNGMDAELSVEQGVKQFLENKPYLVKSQARGGAGTGPANLPGNQGSRDHAFELQAAMQSGDRKKVMELKQEIRNKHSAGVSRTGGFTVIGR